MGWNLEWRSTNTEALLGIVVLGEVRVGPSPQWLAKRLQAPTVPQEHTEALDRSVRAMLRAGGFRPTGRNRPAQEFLARLPGGPPSICNLVDLNNALSLAHRLPASIIDASVASGGLVVREGTAGERYIFNRAGQALDLEGLLVVCDASGRPIASPVKDSLRAHIGEWTSEAIFCAYGSVTLLGEVGMARLLYEFVESASSLAGGGFKAGWIASVRGVNPWRPSRT